MAKKSISEALKKRWYIILLLILVLLFGKKLLVLGAFVFIVTTTLIVAAHRLLLQTSLGLELVTFYSTVLTLAYGPVVGILFAVTLTFTTHMINKNFCIFLLIKCLVYSITCVIVSFVSPLGIVVAGIIATLVRNASLLLITYAMNPGRVMAEIPSTGINIALNLILFMRFGHGLLALL